MDPIINYRSSITRDTISKSLSSSNTGDMAPSLNGQSQSTINSGSSSSRKPNNTPTPVASDLMFTCNLQISVKQFFDLFLSDNAPCSFGQFYTNMPSPPIQSPVKCEPWSSNGERHLDYTVKVKHPLGSSITRVKQHYQLFVDGSEVQCGIRIKDSCNELCFRQQVDTPDVPCGNSFRVVQYWYVTRADQQQSTNQRKNSNGSSTASTLLSSSTSSLQTNSLNSQQTNEIKVGCQLKVYSQVQILKTTLFSRMISTKSATECQSFIQSWHSSALIAIESFGGSNGTQKDGCERKFGVSMKQTEEAHEIFDWLHVFDWWHLFYSIIVFLKAIFVSTIGALLSEIQKPKASTAIQAGIFIVLIIIAIELNFIANFLVRMAPNYRLAS